MTPATKYKQRFVCNTENNETSPAVIHDRILLHVTRAACVIMLAALGFLLNNYMDSIQKDMDGMALSIGKISNAQDNLSIMLARIDESIRNIEQRLNKTENSIDNIKKP